MVVIKPEEWFTEGASRDDMIEQQKARPKGADVTGQTLWVTAVTSQQTSGDAWIMTIPSCYGSEKKKCV